MCIHIHVHIYIYISKFICWPPQDLYFSIWLTFLALKWSHLLQKVSWSLRIAFWNIALPLSIELFPFNKNNTHPFLIKLFFTQNLPFLLKLLFLLSVSTPVWYDSSVFIKVFLNKIHPLSIEPVLQCNASFAKYYHTIVPLQEFSSFLIYSNSFPRVFVSM